LSLKLFSKSSEACYTRNLVVELRGKSSNTLRKVISSVSLV